MTKTARIRSESIEDYNGGKIISLRTAKLLKLRLKMKKLRDEIIDNVKDHMEECKNVYDIANILIGELNDSIKVKRE